MKASAIPSIVLVAGWLTEEKLNRITQEVHTAITNHRDICLCIDSPGGVFNAKTIAIIEQLQAYEHTSAKIYSATSVAAMLALSTRHREIVSTGTVCIHDGEVRVKAGQVTSEGQIICYKEGVALLHKTVQINQHLLKSCTPGLTNVHYSTYSATGTITLSAQECIATGLAHLLY